jgi:triphosphoribosyl-dephospho-CoA synthetase
MAKYILEEILQIRNLRRNIAEKNLKQAQRLVEEAKENAENAKVPEEFQIIIEKESQRLNKKVMMQKIQKDAVGALHYIIKTLKDKLITHKQNLAIAKDNVIRAKKGVGKKRSFTRGK